MKAKKPSGKKQVKRAVKSAVRRQKGTEAVDLVEPVRVRGDQFIIKRKHKPTKTKKKK